jgi:hypothetical protein
VVLISTGLLITVLLVFGRTNGLRALVGTFSGCIYGFFCKKVAGCMPFLGDETSLGFCSTV